MERVNVSFHWITYNLIKQIQHVVIKSILNINVLMIQIISMKKHYIMKDIFNLINLNLIYNYHVVVQNNKNQIIQEINVKIIKFLIVNVSVVMY